MLATLYKNNSDERYVDKSLTTIFENVDCILKDNQEVIKPHLILSQGITPTVNYVYLDELERYYFVRDKILELGQCVELILEIDTLSTYKNELRSNHAIISRNEFEFNLYQNDDRWKLYSYTAKRTIPFPSGFNMGTQQFILGIAGGEVIDGS